MMRFSYKSGKGQEIEFTATVKKKVASPSGLDSGDLGDRPEPRGPWVVASYKMEVRVDGKIVAESSHDNVKEWRPVKLGKMSAEAYKLPEGTELTRVNNAKFVMPDEARAAYVAWLDEVEAAGETEDTLAIKAEKQAQAKKVAVARLKKQIAEAEGQADLPATKAEAAKIEKRQKEFLAEEHDAEWAEMGGRHVYSREELEEMRARLADLTA